MRKRNGFSLIEINMAIFVMAAGVLAIAALYPLGLRESILSQSDFKQVMFADYVLNIAVTAACSTNVTWSEWSQWAEAYNMANDSSGKGELRKLSDTACVPDFIWNSLSPAIERYSSQMQLGAGSGQNKRHTRNLTYAVYCVLVPSFSDQIMGIMVRSLDMDTSKMSSDEKKRRLESQPVYYAEARFQGKYNE